jgi:hypothetical protein
MVYNVPQMLPARDTVTKPSSKTVHLMQRDADRTEVGSGDEVVHKKRRGRPPMSDLQREEKRIERQKEKKTLRAIAHTLIAKPIAIQQADGNSSSSSDDDDSLQSTDVDEV